MKYLSLFLTAMLLTLTLQAEEDEKIISSKIDKVTVFMQGAQVNRTGSILIPKGTSYIVFDDVSSSINTQSIQASGVGNFTIMDVQYRYQFPTPEEVDNSLPNHIQNQIDDLNDTLRYMAVVRRNINDRQTALQTEHNLILNHPLIKGQGKKIDSLDLLVGTVAFLQDQLIDIASRQMRLQLETNVLDKRENDVRKKLMALQNYNANKPKPKPTQPKHQVLVYVTSEQTLNATLSINYAVNNAGWYPWYDIKAKSASDPIELVYKAAVHQNTGEDWSNVRLTVSNANPLRSATKPILPVWYINYYVQRVQATSAMKKVPYMQRESKEEMEDMALAKDEDVRAGMADDYTQRMQNFTSVEFEIDLPARIKNDGKAHFVSIARNELKGTFQHYIVPKLDNDAFVVANVVDWENLDLLPGNANLYFGNTYVGRTVLDPTIVTDTLKLAMGRDHSIAVKRTKLVSETKSKIIGSEKVYTATYQIEVRNNGASETRITIEDQIPVTTNEKIKIELEKADRAKIDDRTGFLTWDIKIGSKKTEKLTYTYKVTYPKDQTIAGL